uniref:Uncharacterized protein n=1 Tax=Rhizophora mucronata TaxID=61149 RepID=A0A2P2KN01_RHIMU
MSYLEVDCFCRLNFSYGIDLCGCGWENNKIHGIFFIFSNLSALYGVCHFKHEAQTSFNHMGMNILSENSSLFIIDIEFKFAIRWHILVILVSFLC